MILVGGVGPHILPHLFEVPPPPPLIDVNRPWKSMVLMEVKIARRQRRWKLHLKILSNSRSFKLHSVYPSLLTLIIVDELLRIWIPKNHIQLQSEKKIHLHLFASCRKSKIRPIKLGNFTLWSCSGGKEVKYMKKCEIRGIAFLTFLLPSPSWHQGT